MNDSYLGIITPRGLETLVVETKHAAMFLLRRVAKRPSGDAIAFWVVLDGRTARDLKKHIDRQRFQDALCQLNNYAVHIGTLFPPWEEENLMRSVR